MSVGYGRTPDRAVIRLASLLEQVMVRCPGGSAGVVVIELKAAEEIDRMAVAGQFVDELLAELSGAAAVGSTRPT
jgi:hypothetical protein